jgi:hypothetical protein
LIFSLTLDEPIKPAITPAGIIESKEYVIYAGIPPDGSIKIIVGKISQTVTPIPMLVFQYVLASAVIVDEIIPTMNPIIDPASTIIPESRLLETGTGKADD